MAMGKVAVLLVSLVHCVAWSAAQALSNYSYPVFAFRDSLTDVDNAIAAFLKKFAHLELNPYGVEFSMHPVDLFTDSKLFIKLLAFGVRRRSIYPVLRGTGLDFSYGTNFACSGLLARNEAYWSKNSRFYTPFSLDVQMKWRSCYQERLWFYEYLNPGSESLRPDIKGFFNSQEVTESGRPTGSKPRLGVTTPFYTQTPV